MLKYRLISFPLLLLLAFAVVFWQPYGTWIFAVLALPVALAAVWESCALAEKLNLPVNRLLAMVFAVYCIGVYGILQFSLSGIRGVGILLTALLVLLMLKTLFTAEDKRSKMVIAAFVTPGVLLFALLPVIALIRIYLNYGALIFLSLVLATKASDTGGYIVGMLSNKLMKNGNHKIVPSISPKKSWEGTVGAAIFSIGTAALLTHFNCIKLDLVQIFIFGFLAFLGSFAGDLTESQLKRVAGIKDSANWIPGMGGILDVLDSFIYNAPVFYLVLNLGVISCQ